MKSEEFDLANDIMSRHGQEKRASPYTSRAMEPASFREIGWYELARQYVAHRKFREPERLAAQQATNGDGPPDRVLLGFPAGGHGPRSVAELAAHRPEERDSWLSTLARRLGWR